MAFGPGLNEAQLNQYSGLRNSQWIWPTFVDADNVLVAADQAGSAPFIVGDALTLLNVGQIPCDAQRRRSWHLVQD